MTESQKYLTLFLDKYSSFLFEMLLDVIYSNYFYLFEIARGEIVLGLGYVGVVGSELALVDLQRALVVLLHLLVFILRITSAWLDKGHLQGMRTYCNFVLINCVFTILLRW